MPPENERKSQTPRRRRRTRGPKPAGPASSRPFELNRPPLKLLDEAELEKLHQASLAILARTGVIFNSPAAIRHFVRAGANVQDNRVYLSEDLLQEVLSEAPAEYTLQARNPANNVRIGGRHLAVMPGGGPPFVLDLDGLRRPGSLTDLENFARLSQLSRDVHVIARKAVEAQDVPVAVRHLECWRAVLTLTDKPAQSGMVGGRAEAEDVLEMLSIVFGGADRIDGRPVAHCSINVNSPLFYDTAMVESLITFAERGQPVLVSPFVMAGVTGPATLSGALAQHNAEVLAGAALTQLVRPGTPVLYGTASSNVDMRNAAPAIGSPESAISIAVCAQLARRYGLPCRGGGALTDSPIPDAQSNYERMFTLLVSVLSGVNYVMHGLGILESYLTISYTQFVIDLDLLRMIRRFLQPLDISDDSLALDAIDAVGPGGFFLETQHTLKHFREAHFIPEIAIRQPFEQWEIEGGRDAAQRATERCRELLAAYSPPPINEDIMHRLDDYVERRKAQLLG